MEEDFYASLKLKSGEEIFARVAPSEEEDRTILILSNPICISEVKTKSGLMGYKVEPWLKTSREDMFIVDMDNVITMSECNDPEMMVLHQQFVHDTGEGIGSSKINKRMGYIANVNDAKEILEKIYKNSNTKS
mgnify:FL=1|jgi:hypothetical protein|tara:strand:+ start:40 stop:438 length:399 start_codon:yes stop_codon:yes gene_type:complete